MPTPEDQLATTIDDLTHAEFMVRYAYMLGSLTAHLRRTAAGRQALRRARDAADSLILDQRAREATRKEGDNA